MDADAPVDRTITIFFVEDHAAIREALAGYLDDRPQMRVVAQSEKGADVPAACARIRPDVLLLDLELPDGSGLEVCCAVRLVAPETQVLVFTSQVDGRIAREAIESGALGVLEKSAPLQTLVTAVERVAQGHAFLGSGAMEALQERDVILPSGSETPLTDREIEIMRLIAEGLSNKEVAVNLGISLKTAENHRHRLMRKLGAHNAADLTREAFRVGLISRASPRRRP